MQFCPGGGPISSNCRPSSPPDEKLRRTVFCACSRSFRNYQRFHFGQRVQLANQPITSRFRIRRETIKNPILFPRVKLVRTSQEELLLIFFFSRVEKFVRKMDGGESRSSFAPNNEEIKSRRAMVISSITQESSLIIRNHRN